MIARLLAVATAAATLSACVPSYAPKPGPVTVRTIAGSYRDVALCAYDALQARIGQVTKIDRPEGVNIERGEQYVLYWILEIRPAGAGRTSLGMRPGPWMLGERMNSDEVIPFVVASCAR